MRETLTHKNNNITFIILTNTREFYLIDAREFLPFLKHKAILQAFKNCENKEGNDTRTEAFYNALKDILPSLDFTLKYTYFCIDSTLLDSTNATNSTNLALIYQILSPQVLLKHKSYIDANTLNQGFYNELLYLLGLEETTQNAKVLIAPSQSKNTLLDALCESFKLDKRNDFETCFALLTTWNNRLLFLRLLESMLLSFEHISKPFLDVESIPSFSTLNTLFFEVLAKVEESRDSTLAQSLSSIPYLNSSLFDKTELEKKGKEIKFLESKPLSVYKDSILYKDQNLKAKLNLKSKDSTLPLLEYLFAFLHAYDFTTTAQDIQNHTKINFDKLINAAVLGLVFEKLNGYKEGSFYTPSFITSYMCKQSLQKVALEKFNTAKNWDCQNLEELKTRLDKLTETKQGYKEANAIFDSIRICDPAVGSGHFLVSALNEMILLKFELRILVDENYERLKDIELKLFNDEIIVINSLGKPFIYTLPAHENIESHKIQKALFHTKRTLIESCLFGVDINPNSCEITKLRLWIELLKYSYYKDIANKRLETLPNIDINIKCGNSLVSNIALDTTKDSIIKKLKNIANKKASLEASAEFRAIANDLQNKLPDKIEEYKNAVNAYKNETNADFKTLHKDTITQCQVFITELFYKMSNEYRIFKESLAKYLENSGYEGIDEGKINNQPLDSEIKKKLNAYTTNFNFHKTLDIPKDSVGFVEKELIELVKSLEKYEHFKNTQNAFEWRFAFPEVLDTNGDFLGFDLVIGNPPYIDYRKIDEITKSFLQKDSFIYSISKKGSIFVYFIEKAARLMHERGYCIFINPINYICQDSGTGIREFINNNLSLISMIDVSNFKVFDSASTYTCINYFTRKNKEIEEIKFGKVNCEKEINDIVLEKLQTTKIENLSVFLDSVATKIFKLNYSQLSNFCDIFCALSIAGFRQDVKTIKAKNSVPFLESSDIKRYDYRQGKFLHNATSYYSTEKTQIFRDAEIIFMARMTNFIRCCIAPMGYFGGKVNVLHNFKVDKKFILGVLNSKLISYFYAQKYFASHMQGGAFGFDTLSVGGLPIPKITKANQKIVDKIIALVDEILESKATDSTTNTNDLESEIDSLVYQLYNLDEAEIKIINGF